MRKKKRKKEIKQKDDALFQLLDASRHLLHISTKYLRLDGSTDDLGEACRLFISVWNRMVVTQNLGSEYLIPPRLVHGKGENEE